MDMEDLTEKDLHRKIVNEILPHFADELKREGVISTYDRKPFMIPLAEDWPPFRIYPDLVLDIPDTGKVLVEITNPKDPKRFIGEIMYPQILGYRKEIVAAIIFVLRRRRQDLMHDRGFTQMMTLSDVFKRQIRTVKASWPTSEDVAYRNLKALLTHQREWLSGKEP